MAARSSATARSRIPSAFHLRRLSAAVCTGYRRRRKAATAPATPAPARASQFRWGSHPELGTAVTGAAVEAAVRAEVARYRLPEVHGPVWARRAVVLLRVIAGPAQIVAQQARDEFLPPDRCHGRPADIQLASVVLRGPDDRLSGNIRLKDGRDRLQPMRHSRLAPSEL